MDGPHRVRPSPARHLGRASERRGSSREVAPIAIRGSGTSAVIARSFARIFYRNALNLGLPIFECPEAVDGISSGDEIEVDVAPDKERLAFRALSGTKA